MHGIYPVSIFLDPVDVNTLQLQNPKIDLQSAQILLSSAKKVMFFLLSEKNMCGFTYYRTHNAQSLGLYSISISLCKYNRLCQTTRLLSSLEPCSAVQVFLSILLILSF